MAVRRAQTMEGAADTPATIASLTTGTYSRSLGSEECTENVPSLSKTQSSLSENNAAVGSSLMNKFQGAALHTIAHLQSQHLQQFKHAVGVRHGAFAAFAHLLSASRFISLWRKIPEASLLESMAVTAAAAMVSTRTGLSMNGTQSACRSVNKPTSGRTSSLHQFHTKDGRKITGRTPVLLSSAASTVRLELK